jgi:hypothetical protein
MLAPVEKIIMYIPVALATLGGHPKLSKSGLKMEPPPSPRAPETHPPIKENATSLAIGAPDKLISEDASPEPYLTFRSCSFYRFFVAKTLTPKQTPM